jgi:hypothetical protein
MDLGTNVKAEVKGKVLTITVNLDQDNGNTPKGFRRIATTNGNVTLPGGEKLGLNVYAGR